MDIFLVGGFSRSVVLKETMINNFQNETTKIVVPNNQGMAVAQGAVYFASRYSAFTYGIECRHRFVDGVDPPENKIKIGDVWFCDMAFSSLVQINQKVKLNHRTSTFVGRVSKHHSTVLLPIYCTKEENPHCIKNMRKLGEIKLDVPIDEELGTHNVKVTMIFGGTEIAVKAKHILTRKQVLCRLEFVHTSKSEITALPPPI